MTSKKGTLVVVVGPTGSGKTDVAVELAKHLRAPILSTD
ncbi:isopentenyl transferase family protein, partial [uncultured Alistipes sp.]